MNFLTAFQVHNGKNVTWEQAIQIGNNLLVNHQCATEKLAEAIIQITKELGPYYILAPGVALAHAAPGDYALKPALVLTIFQNKIKFAEGEKYHVDLLFSLSANDPKGHIELIQAFALKFQDPESLKKLRSCNNFSEIQNFFKE